MNSRVTIRSLLCRMVQDIESADVSSLCPKEPGGLYGSRKCGWDTQKGARKLFTFDLIEKLGPMKA